MSVLRALRHPLAPLVLVIVVLPAAILLAPAPMRAGLLVLLFGLGSPVAAVSAVLSLRRWLARNPAGASEPSYREKTLETNLRWVLILVPVLGSAAIGFAGLATPSFRPEPIPGREYIELSPQAAVFLAAVPLLFMVLAVRLWTDLVAVRRRRAQGLPPLPPEPASTTGDPGLDRRLKTKSRAAFRLGVFTLLASAVANVLPPMERDPDKLPWAVLRLAKVTSRIDAGEPYRFVTATFVHGDLAALAVGILAFVAVAPMVGALAGTFWLVTTFVAGGFAATVASYAFMPETRIYLGMTGAVAALAGLLLVLGALHRNRLPPAALRHIRVRVAAVLVVLAFASALLRHADVAAHLGGFAFGAVLALFVRPQPSVREAMEQARAEALARRETSA